jgi:hypothetical protein
MSKITYLGNGAAWAIPRPEHDPIVEFQVAMHNAAAVKGGKPSCYISCKYQLLPQT